MTCLLLDVNETLSDTAPLAGRFTDLGLPSHTADLWFASVLRDGFALTALGGSRPFAEVARGVLSQLLPEEDFDGAVSHVLGAFTSLEVHPDVVPGLRALADGGHRVLTLSNGAAGVAESLLERAGARHLVERCLSVDDASAWKPAPQAYEYAAAVTGVSLAEMVMVAVHPWDLEGARTVGMRTVYVNRSGARYPTHLSEPDLTVRSFADVADALTCGRPAHSSG